MTAGPRHASTSVGGLRAAPLAIAGVSTLALLVLGVLVATQVTQGIDVAVRDALRPGDAWGTAQVRVSVLVEGLKPRNAAVLLALFGLAVALWRRSRRPALYVATLAGVTAVSTLAVKFVVGRSDPHHEMTAVGGSFPSGHTVVVVVGLGLVVLVLRRRSRWWEWVAVAVVGAAMAFSVVLQAAHWFTDVVGGALLAVAILAVASTSTLREPAQQTVGVDATRPGRGARTSPKISSSSFSRSVSFAWPRRPHPRSLRQAEVGEVSHDDPDRVPLVDPPLGRPRSSG